MRVVGTADSSCLWHSDTVPLTTQYIPQRATAFDAAPACLTNTRYPLPTLILSSSRVPSPPHSRASVSWIATMTMNPPPSPHARPAKDTGTTRSKGFVCGRTVVPVPNRNSKVRRGRLGTSRFHPACLPVSPVSSDPKLNLQTFISNPISRTRHRYRVSWSHPDFAYAEHCFIGDATTLTLASGTKIAASSHSFALSNGLNLTYGQINALAGDFYGTDSPISSASSAADRTTRSLAALDTLIGSNPRQPAEAQSLLKLLQSEVDAVNTALSTHQDPSVAYAKLPDQTLQFEAATFARPSSLPGYIGLAQINFDHFGADARVAYNTGHAEAMRIAKEEKDLERAYVVDAYAVHFLEDSFAAGHMRTPRRALHDDVDLTADACAKVRAVLCSGRGARLMRRV